MWKREACGKERHYIQVTVAAIRLPTAYPLDGESAAPTGLSCVVPLTRDHLVHVYWNKHYSTNMISDWIIIRRTYSTWSSAITTNGIGCNYMFPAGGCVYPVMDGSSPSAGLPAASKFKE